MLLLLQNIIYWKLLLYIIIIFIIVSIKVDYISARILVLKDYCTNIIIAVIV